MALRREVLELFLEHLDDCNHPLVLSAVARVVCYQTIYALAMYICLMLTFANAVCDHPHIVMTLLTGSRRHKGIGG